MVNKLLVRNQRAMVGVDGLNASDQVRWPFMADIKNKRNKQREMVHVVYFFFKDIRSCRSQARK